MCERKSKRLKLNGGMEIDVSPDGKIFKDGKEVKIQQYPSGYCYMTLNGKDHYLVHKLVATAFIQSLERGDRSLHVHHIDGDKTNNKVENLQVMTMEEHQKLHKQIYPLQKKCTVCGKMFTPKPTKRKRAKTCSYECWLKKTLETVDKQKKKIDQYTLNGIYVKTFDSMSDAEREIQGFASNICKCCKGQIGSYKGFIWRYHVDNSVGFVVNE